MGKGGVFRRRAVDNDPVFQEIFRQERWDVIPGAEPHDDFDARSGAASNASSRRIPTNACGRRARRRDRPPPAPRHEPRRFAFSGADNASISEVVADRERIVLRRYNDVSHLLPLRASALDQTRRTRRRRGEPAAGARAAHRPAEPGSRGSPDACRAGARGMPSRSSIHRYCGSASRQACAASSAASSRFDPPSRPVIQRSSSPRRPPNPCTDTTTSTCSRNAARPSDCAGS